MACGECDKAWDSWMEFRDENINLKARIEELEKQKDFWVDSSKEWSKNCFEMLEASRVKDGKITKLKEALKETGLDLKQRDGQSDQSRR